MAGWLQRLKSGLQRSSDQLSGKISALLTHRKIDDTTLQELEDILIEADLGVVLAGTLIKKMAKHRFPPEMTGLDVRTFLADEMAAILRPFTAPLVPELVQKPWVCVMVGVNGSGKTTTLGKLATQWAQEGFKIRAVAADTFRAAAVEQLQIWGTRAGIPVKIAPHGTDAAALVFQAFEEARREKDDILLIDTAGRLHNKQHLMDELGKIVRVLQKIDVAAPHSCLLVLDGTIGQNSLAQVEVFKKMVPLTGLIITKLDGTARGGVVVSLAETFHLPLHAIGVGENPEDLQPFDAFAFSHLLMGITPGERQVMRRA